MIKFLFFLQPPNIIDITNSTKTPPTLMLKNVNIIPPQIPSTVLITSWSSYYLSTSSSTNDNNGNIKINNYD